MCSKTCHLKSKSPLFHSPSVAAAVLNIYHQHIWGGYVKSANVGGQRSATKLKGRTERASNRRVFNNCYSFQRERDLALFVCRLIVAPLIFLISFSHGCYHRSWSHLLGYSSSFQPKNWYQIPPPSPPTVLNWHNTRHLHKRCDFKWLEIDIIERNK